MTEFMAQALWILAPGKARIGEVRVPEAIVSEADPPARVRTRYSAISRGTESLVFRGEVPESEYQRMRAPFQEGEFPGPVKYGYANVGVVEEGPSALQGKEVFCLYPHQTHYRVPSSALVPLPADVRPELAVLAANMETAVNGLWDAAPAIGDRIAIVGCGVVGALVAYLASRIPGTAVQVVDVDPGRDALVRRLGGDFATPDKARAGNDLVIHTSGTPAGLVTALELAGREARIVEMSWFGNREVSLPLGEAFHSQRLSIGSSQVGTVSPGHAPRWSHRDRLSLAVSLLNDTVLDCLIDDESRFEELPEVMRRLSEHPDGALCHRIRY